MDILLNAGDEVRQPFRIMVGPDVADLTGCTVSAKIFTTSPIVLTEGAGITILDRQPTDGPHGYFVLDEDATPKILFGRQTRMRLIVVSADDVTMSSVDTYFNRLG